MSGTIFFYFPPHAQNATAPPGLAYDSAAYQHSHRLQHAAPGNKQDVAGEPASLASTKPVPSVSVAAHPVAETTGTKTTEPAKPRPAFASAPPAAGFSPQKSTSAASPRTLAGPGQGSPRKAAPVTSAVDEALASRSPARLSPMKRDAELDSLRHRMYAYCCFFYSCCRGYKLTDADSRSFP
jgi:hypothetical protein